ncbi:MAG TPA: hypothetical protein VGK89_06905 [Candidatus Eisenbacteria bacterium]|jgi:hypothetical protein
MKHSRPVLAALIVLALGSWVTSGFACEDKAKAAAAAASKSSGCSAAMAAQCTPEMAAACKARAASAAAMTGCSHATSAAKSVSGCPHSKNSGVNAFMAGTGEPQVDAVVAGSGAGCNHGSASGAEAGRCNGQGAAKWADHSNHSDCDACSDMAFCDGEVRGIGATVQVVPLKNGVMYVYTADGPGKVHAVQASMERRNDRMVGILAAGDRVHLCSSCKAMRGAIASGKLNRELVNIEGGCLTLMTSNDPQMVAKIYSMAGVKGLASKI